MSPRDNGHLQILPEDEYARFEPHLELVRLNKGETLFNPGEVPTFVYYPVDAIAPRVRIVVASIDQPRGRR